MIAILNDAQREWLDKQKTFINQQIGTCFPLTDEQWKQVADTAASIIAKAKGHEQEVRKEIFDVVEKWDKKAKEGVNK